jgi:hypothetical protein
LRECTAEFPARLDQREWLGLDKGNIGIVAQRTEPAADPPASVKVASNSGTPSMRRPAPRR